MEKSTKAAKSDWEGQLRVKASSVFSELTEAAQEDSHIEIIYAALKEMTLESWKNGLAAGRARSRKQSASSTKSA